MSIHREQFNKETPRQRKLKAELANSRDAGAVSKKIKIYEEHGLREEAEMRILELQQGAKNIKTEAKEAVQVVQKEASKDTMEEFKEETGAIAEEAEEVVASAEQKIDIIVASSEETQGGKNKELEDRFANLTQSRNDEIDQKADNILEKIETEQEKGDFAKIYKEIELQVKKGEDNVTSPLQEKYPNFTKKIRGIEESFINELNANAALFARNRKGILEDSTKTEEQKKELINKLREENIIELGNMPKKYRSNVDALNLTSVEPPPIPKAAEPPPIPKMVQPPPIPEISRQEPPLIPNIDKKIVGDNAPVGMPPIPKRIEPQPIPNSIPEQPQQKPENKEVVESKVTKFKREQVEKVAELKKLQNSLIEKKAKQFNLNQPEWITSSKNTIKPAPFEKTDYDKIVGGWVDEGIANIRANKEIDKKFADLFDRKPEPIPQAQIEDLKDLAKENEKARSKYYEFKNDKSKQEGKKYEKKLEKREQAYRESKNKIVSTLLKEGRTAEAKEFIASEVEFQYANDTENGSISRKIKTGISNTIEAWDKLGMPKEGDSTKQKILKAGIRLGKMAASIAAIGLASSYSVQGLANLGVGTASALQGGTTSLLASKLKWGLGIGAVMDTTMTSVPSKNKKLVGKIMQYTLIAGSATLAIASGAWVAGLAVGASSAAGYGLSKLIQGRYSEQKIQERKDRAKEGELRVENLEEDVEQLERECEQAIKDAKNTRFKRKLAGAVVGIVGSGLTMELSGAVHDQREAQAYREAHPKEFIKDGNSNWIEKPKFLENTPLEEKAVIEKGYGFTHGLRDLNKIAYTTDTGDLMKGHQPDWATHTLGENPTAQQLADFAKTIGTYDPIHPLDSFVMQPGDDMSWKGDELILERNGHSFVMAHGDGHGGFVKGDWQEQMTNEKFMHTIHNSNSDIHKPTEPTPQDGNIGSITPEKPEEVTHDTPVSPVRSEEVAATTPIAEIVPKGVTHETPVVPVKPEQVTHGTPVAPEKPEEVTHGDQHTQTHAEMESLAQNIHDNNLVKIFGNNIREWNDEFKNMDANHFLNDDIKGLSPEMLRLKENLLFWKTELHIIPQEENSYQTADNLDRFLNRICEKAASDPYLVDKVKL